MKRHVSLARTRWPKTARLAFLAIALSCGACTLSPKNGQVLGSTDESLTFSGFVSAPGQSIDVQVQDCVTGDWRTVASGRSGEEEYAVCGERLHSWEISGVTLPQTYDRWCESYGALWVYTRVIVEGSPLPSFGRPWQDDCDVASLCDPERRRACANLDGRIMPRGRSAGCIDRLQ
jgi:hypothetical protein